MKYLMILLISVLINPINTFAETPDASIEKLIWTCSKDGDSQSVMIFSTSEAYKHSSEMVLFIEDRQICNSLNIKCPFEAGVFKSSLFPDFKGRYMYESRKINQRDGVMFSSKEGGIILHSLYLDNRVYVNWDKNWFFKYGQCIKHN